MELGCCPKAGNFFKYLHLPESPVASARMLIADLMENPGTFGVDKLPLVDDLLEEAQNSFTSSTPFIGKRDGSKRNIYRNIDKENLLKIKKIIKKAKTVIDGINTNSNTFFEDSMMLIKAQLRRIEDQILQGIDILETPQSTTIRQNVQPPVTTPPECQGNLFKRNNC